MPRPNRSDPFLSALQKGIGKQAKLGSIAKPVSAFRSGLANRRRRTSDAGSVQGTKTVTLQLIEGEDYLDWEEIPPVLPGTRLPGMRQAKRGASGSTSEGTTVLEFSRLAPSDVGSFLEKTDTKLTPQRGLRRWNPESQKLESARPTGKPMFLVLHGTFSNSDSFFRSLTGTEHGKSFLAKTLRKYKGELYAFDHPTLSVSPVMNALDLQRALESRTSRVDILAHSRGGLVARWWTHLFDPVGIRCQRALLVGSPLAGTSLAAPPNIRNAIRQLTSYGKILSETARLASMAVPCLTLVHALLQTLTSISGMATSLPFADAAIAMIPGLCGQSRVGNNPELVRLQSNQLVSEDRFYTVASHFQSMAIGWKFWRAFRKEQLADKATDWIFDGPNDLVVDCESMLQLTDSQVVPDSRRLDFGINDRIHHINYFDFEETSEFMCSTFRF